MFRKLEKQLYLEELVLLFEGKLRADNGWVKGRIPQGRC